LKDATVITITGSNPYNWSLTLPTLNTGQQVEIYITATVDEINTGFIAAQTQVDNELNILTSRLTAARATYLDKLNVAGTLANTSNADAFKADTILIPQKCLDISHPPAHQYWQHSRKPSGRRPAEYLPRYDCAHLADQLGRNWSG